MTASPAQPEAPPQALAITPFTTVWLVKEGSSVARYREAIVSDLPCTHTPP